MGKFEAGKYGLGLTGQENDTHKFVKDSWSESMKSNLGLDKQEAIEAPEKSENEQAESKFESVKDYARKALDHINKGLNREDMMSPLGLKEAMKDIGVDESSAEALRIQAFDSDFDKRTEAIIAEIQTMEKLAGGSEIAEADSAQANPENSSESVIGVSAISKDETTKRLKELNQDFIASMKSASTAQAGKTESVSTETASSVNNEATETDNESVMAKKLQQLEDIQDYLKADVPLGYAGGESLESFLDQTTPDVKQEIVQLVESWQEADRVEGGMHHDKVDPATGKYNRQFYLSQVAEAAKQLYSKYNPENPGVPTDVSVEAEPSVVAEKKESEPVNDQPEVQPVTSETVIEPAVAESQESVVEPATVAEVPAPTPEQNSSSVQSEQELTPEKKVSFKQALNEAFGGSGYFDQVQSLLKTFEQANNEGQDMLITPEVASNLQQHLTQYFEVVNKSGLDETSLIQITEQLNQDFEQMLEIPRKSSVNLDVDTLDKVARQISGIGAMQKKLIDRIEQIDPSADRQQTANIRKSMQRGLGLLEKKFNQIRSIKQRLVDYQAGVY